jgi:hypothetical protein
MTAPCRFRPFPGYGAYGHWTCQRSRWHPGRHRYRNYTIARVPRVWRLRRLWAAFQLDRRLRRHHGKAYGYRRALFPSRYEPVS